VWPVAGWWAKVTLPLDATPDPSDTQVIVSSNWDRRPDIIQDQVTYLIVTAMLFRKGRRMRGVVKGKRWLLLTRWVNLDGQKWQQLNDLFALNRRVMKAYLLKESLERLWTYRYEGAMLRYLRSWIDELRWQRLAPFQKLAQMLLDHLTGYEKD
jgi:transposase